MVNRDKKSSVKFCMYALVSGGQVIRVLGRPPTMNTHLTFNVLSLDSSWSLHSLESVNIGHFAGLLLTPAHVYTDCDMFCKKYTLICLNSHSNCFYGPEFPADSVVD